MSATVSPDDYELNDTQRQVRTSCVAMFAVSVVFVALRCFVRVRLQSQFSVDDWLLVAGLIGYLAMTVMICFSINDGGFGRKTAELSVETFYIGAKVGAVRYWGHANAKSMQFLVLAQTIYTLAMMITKLSIALLQLRIIGQTSIVMRRINYVSIAVNVIIGIYEFFALLFQCTPVRFLFSDDTVKLQNTHSRYRNGVATGVYVYSAVNLALDWYYALALVPLVLKLQMRTVVKISTVFVLGVGVVASVANIIRFKSLIGYAQQVDVLYIFIPIAVWTWAEMCLALTGAAFATFRPLVRLFPWGSSRNGSNKYSGGPSPFTSWKTWGTPNRRKDPMELSDMGITNVTVQGGTIYANEPHNGDREANTGPASIGDADSQKYILKEQSVEMPKGYDEMIINCLSVYYDNNLGLPQGLSDVRECFWNYCCAKYGYHANVC
ncbi:putative integral membrane protein [Neofusicoccum parvum UCRNP2]|uniref:Putative integral membrane protein n=1 Tax=Botryosphaeria parva (strain UCR-NP2) TaxID=1287680 RepID=R1GUI4_BOTPV|nr:putative integral membrane protein [Neofusicoccum parvum UCRNP2]